MALGEESLKSRRQKFHTFQSTGLAQELPQIKPDGLLTPCDWIGVHIRVGLSIHVVRLWLAQGKDECRPARPNSIVYEKRCRKS